MKFLQPDFLAKTVSLCKPNGFVALNTIITNQEMGKLAMNYCKSVKGCLKFAAYCADDLNVVLFFVKGGHNKQEKAVLEDGEVRTVHMGKLVNSWGLQRGIWMNKKQMPIHGFIQ